MIDSHCHLDFEAFDADRQEVIASCVRQGIQAILIPGVKASAWHKQLQIAKSSNYLFAALGLHPFFLNSFEPQHISELEKLLRCELVLAVGEIGLDFAIDIAPKLQQQVFIQQLELAQQFDMPVIVHHRQSHNDLIRLLKLHHPPKGGVIHAFSGSMQVADSYIQLGFKLGVGGGITYERAKKTRAVFQQLALEHLLLETDAPDMPISGYQGQRNTPERLPVILQQLAELRQEPAGYIQQQTTQNFQQLFGC